MLWRSEGHLKQDCEGQKKITVQNLKNNRLDSGLKSPMQPRCHKKDLWEYSPLFSFMLESFLG